MSSSKPSNFRQGGFSIVELMISLTIGLFVVLALVSVIAEGSASSNTNARTSELQANGRFAFETVKQDLRVAGFKGLTWADPPNTPTTNITPITNECLEVGTTAGSFVSNIRQGVWASDDANPFGTNCIPNYLRGDVLVVRYAGATPVPAGAPLVANNFYLRSHYAASEVFRAGTNTACPSPQNTYVAPFTTSPCITGAPGTDLMDFPVNIHVYYISPYTESANENPKIPALYRVTLQSDGSASMAPELVASGIEQFQIQFGSSGSNLITTIYDAGLITNGINNSSFSTLGGGWDFVTSATIWVLARNSTPEPGYKNTNTYNMGNQIYTVNDSYRRELFSGVVQIRNNSISKF
jgi:type IV pilus assembly protein PilW